MPAALELPFVMLAYLTVCRWYDAAVFRRVLRARWLVAASYTAAFCLVELHFDNPYTADDLVVRVAAALVVPPLLARLGEGTTQSPRLGSFVGSALALGALVLVAYDSALLYNLSHVPDLLPPAIGAAAALGLVRLWARRPVTYGPTTYAALSSLGWFITLFAVPALPLRYALGFGARTVALVCGVVVVAAALGWGWDRRPLTRPALAGALGLAAAAAGYLLASGVREARLLVAAAAFLAVGVIACEVMDRVRPQPGPPDRPG